MVIKLEKMGMRILSNANMTVYEGDIYGFVGKNGAGKTTLMKTCLGITNKESGEIKFFNSTNYNKRKKVGALIENPAFLDSYRRRMMSPLPSSAGFMVSMNTL